MGLRSSAKMVWIPGGTFVMRSEHHFPKDAPSHKVMVDGFHMDIHPVTNAEFMTFAEETGYVTLAELGPGTGLQIADSTTPSWNDSRIFIHECMTQGKVKPQTWQPLPDANWRHPLGRDSNLRGLEDHPVVHVAYADVHAYARWAGKDLPTEAQWECAARASNQDKCLREAGLIPNGTHVASTSLGLFPGESTAESDYRPTSPVHAYPPNALGLFDMIGNVWEWTKDFWSPHHDRPRTNIIRRNPKVTNAIESCLVFSSAGQVPRRVLKGGPDLCNSHHIPRYPASARRGRMVDSPACDIGFRCVRLEAPER